MEIFDKALEYARNPRIMAGAYRLPNNCITRSGESRLQAQALKVLRMAIDRVQEDGVNEEDTGYRGAVCQQITLMKARYAYGWKQQSDDYHSKEFNSSEDLKCVLRFLDALGVEWHQTEGASTDEARRLRISSDDFNVIFSPSKHALQQAGGMY